MPRTGPDDISLTAAGDLRDALAAHCCGDIAAATYGLLSIGAADWQAIERRLAALGGSLPELLAAVREESR